MRGRYWSIRAGEFLVCLVSPPVAAGNFFCTPMKDTIEVAAGLVFNQERLLITQRHESDHLGGLWEFPGGKVEPDETLEECLRRELLEELGIDVAVGELVESIRHEYPDRTLLIKFFHCKIISGTPRLLDCQDLQWVEAAELEKYEFPPADAQLLQHLRRELKRWNQSDPKSQLDGTEQ